MMSLLGCSLLFFYIVWCLFSLGALSDLNPRAVVYDLVRLVHTPFVVYMLGTFFAFPTSTVINATILTTLISTISAFILVAHGNIFVEESSEERSKRVWIREAGRGFSKTLDECTSSVSKPVKVLNGHSNGHMNGHANGTPVSNGSKSKIASPKGPKRRITTKA
jgi:hypothetical protein